MDTTPQQIINNDLLYSNLTIEFDKFYTKKDIMERCIKYIKTNIPSRISYSTDLIIEPSAGNGSFMDGIDDLCRTSIFYDISPDHPHITQMDFLTFDFERADKTIYSGLWYDHVHIVGCPPFGNAPEYKTANEFIKKSCEFAKTISFILPKNKTFEFTDDYQCVFNIGLPINSFIVDKLDDTDQKNYMVDFEIETSFQIWVKK